MPGGSSAACSWSVALSPALNNASLQGEEKFKSDAELVKRHGAAVVVMAFDEQGQAATAEDKASCKLLCANCSCMHGLACCGALP
jgi:cobalamin-dependent methionine synthase I